MTSLLFRRTSLALLVMLSATACATKPLAVHRPATIPHGRLADLALPRGTDCIVGVAGGGVLRGKLEGVSADRLTIVTRGADYNDDVRHINEPDVLFVAKVVGRSKTARGWLGAAIVAAITVPLGVSMVGDMVMPAAILGALIGRSTGDSRAEVVYEVSDRGRVLSQSPEEGSLQPR